MIVLGFYPQAILGRSTATLHALVQDIGRCRPREMTWNPLDLRTTCSVLAWFRPELVLAVGALAPVRARPRLARAPAPRRSGSPSATLAVLGVAAGAPRAASRPDSVVAVQRHARDDAFATFFKWLFLAAGALTVLIAAHGDGVRRERDPASSTRCCWRSRSACS